MTVSTEAPILHPDSELPPEWTNTSIFRHREDPYSEMALAEPHQDIIDLGSIDMSQLPHAANITWPIKQPTGIYSPTDADLPYLNVHDRFINAARLVLGNDAFERALVEFTARSYSLRKGRAMFVSKPHIDGMLPDAVHPPRTLMLMGLACNDAPTLTIQGGYDRKSFYRNHEDQEEPSMTWFYKLEGGDKAKVEPIPLNHLLLTGPAIVHFAGNADHDIPTRHFLRYHVFLPE